MKWCIKILLLVLFFSGCASADNLPDPSNDPAALELVQNVMAHAKAEQSSKRAVEAEAKTLQNKIEGPVPTQQMVDTSDMAVKRENSSTALPRPVAMNNSAAPAASSPEPSADPGLLTEQVNTLNQSNLMFQQMVNQRLQVLEARNQMLQDSITKLTEALRLLNQEIHASVPTEAHIVPMQPQNSFKDKIIEWGQSWGGLAFFLVLLGVLFTLFKFWKESPRQLSPAPEAKDVIELDHSLNLARAYLAMEEFDKARELLETIVREGNKEQKSEATTLLRDAIR